MKKTTDNRYCYHISCRNSVGKNAKKNATQVSGRERASVTCEAASRSLSDASVTSGSHVTLIVTLAFFPTCITTVTVRFSKVNRDLVFYFITDGPI